MMEERTLCEGTMATEDILDYVVHMQNDRRGCWYKVWALNQNAKKILEIEIGHLVSACIDEGMMNKAWVIYVMLTFFDTSTS